MTNDNDIDNCRNNKNLDEEYLDEEKLGYRILYLSNKNSGCTMVVRVVSIENSNITGCIYLAVLPYCFKQMIYKQNINFVYK